MFDVGPRGVESVEVGFFREIGFRSWQVYFVIEMSSFGAINRHEVS